MKDRPLCFCMITTFYPPYNFGGDGIFVHHLSNELAQRGHQVEVIHCIDSYRLLGGLEPARGYEDHPNVTVHGLQSGWGFLSPLTTQQAGLPLFKSAHIERILERGFDVIHYHNISLIGGPKILEYGRGIKLYTMHEYWLVCPTHGLFRFNRAVCKQRQCFLCSLVHRRPPQWWRYGNLLKTAVKHVDAFIAPSRFIKEKHREMGLDISIIHLPNFVPWVDGSTITPEKGGDNKISEKPYFLFVGRLEKIKGLATLIPVFRRYKKAQLLIAGKGSRQLQFERLAQDSSNIRFLGYQSSSQLQALYRQAVALIVPSLCFEVFPLTIPEAFRQQTPVIARNLGGMPEVIQESEGGFIYDTEEELVAAMDHLLENPSHRRELGQRAYQVYQHRWTPGAHLQSYFALIRGIAGASAD